MIKGLFAIVHGNYVVSLLFEDMLQILAGHILIFDDGDEEDVTWDAVWYAETVIGPDG